MNGSITLDELDNFLQETNAGVVKVAGLNDSDECVQLCVYAVDERAKDIYNILVQYDELYETLSESDKVEFKVSLVRLDD